MAAKLLHSLTDDKPDLQKQIGCMTGVFQLFDRHQILAGRRITGHHPRRLPPGSSDFNNGTFGIESNNMHLRAPVIEKQSNKNVLEKQRVSTESSRPSFSSSSRSSSFSSLDCNRTAQPESLSFDHIICPGTPSRDQFMSQSSASPQFGRQTLVLRDVVKDSMYREARGSSVKTTMHNEAADRVVKHRDSPRPLQLSKTNDGKQNLPVDLKESLRVLNKLGEPPCHFNEPRELSRSSSACELNNGSSFSVPKDAPQFSYDGKEISRLSFESRDTSKRSMKLKELPRLSLDSKKGLMRSFVSDAKSNILPRTPQKDVGGNPSDEVLSLQRTSGTQIRPSSVVAKLMGLETLPNSVLASDSKMGSIKTQRAEDTGPFSRNSETTDLCKPIQIYNSSRNSCNEQISPRWKNPDSVMKPISRFPIEPAPWRQLDGTRGSQKLASTHQKVPWKEPNPFPSVYSEIEKRLKDLEFTQSGKDLRALKQILEAMQAKGLLETRKGGQDSNSTSLKNQRKPQSDYCSLRTFQSPIVVMKPSKLVEKSGIHASSVIPLDRVSSLPKFQGGNFASKRNGSANSWTAKDHIPKMSRRDNAVNSADMKTNSRNLKLTQTSTRPHQLSRERTTSLCKSSGSISPRLQQKKLEFEKQPRPPAPPLDSSKSIRQSNKLQPESSSPGWRRRPKSFNFLQSDDQFSEISSETWNLSYQENESSLQSDGQIASNPKIDIEFASSEQYGEINGNHSPSIQADKYSIPCSVQKKSTPTLSEDESLAELSTVSPEYPSPVSVLDDAVYIDDTASPLKQTPKTLIGNGTWNSNDNFTKEQWNPTDDHRSNTIGSGLTSQINRKKLQNIDHLVQRLRRLNSSHDEARTDYIASLCENTNPDHRYITEILLASGLLLRDLGSSQTPLQFHPSGHPINPELFLVLEQTKASTLLKAERSTEKFIQLKPNEEKYHRKLIFDAVNEILVRKLALVGHAPEPWLRPDKLARKTLNAQKLLRELCSDIEQLQAKKPKCSSEGEVDGLESIFSENHLESWTDFHGQISGMVLDVERLIFKDLVDEIVIGEAAGLRTKPGKSCRKLCLK